MRWAARAMCSSSPATPRCRMMGRSSPATSPRTASAGKVYTLREPLLGVIAAIYTLQPSAEPGRAQARSQHRQQQQDGTQALGEDSAQRTAARRHSLRGRSAAGDVSAWLTGTPGRSPIELLTHADCGSDHVSPAAWRSASTSPPKAVYKRQVLELGGNDPFHRHGRRGP